MTSATDDLRDVADLVHQLCNGQLTASGMSRLDQYLAQSDAALRCYIEYLDIESQLLCQSSMILGSPEAMITDDAVGPEGPDVDVDAAPHGSRQPAAAHSPGLGFLATGYENSVGFFSSGWPVAYLVATVVMAVGLLVGALVHVSQPEQVAKQSVLPSTFGRGAGGEGGENVTPSRPTVGRITGMVDCQWEGSGLRVQGSDAAISKSPNLQTSKSLVSLGDNFALASGLVEITYDTGAKVILQGPVTYQVESHNGGFMSVGKLTGKVENRAAIGFSVRTPVATVTDMGTEFGVEVDSQGQVDVHVFQGEVRCGVPAAKPGSPKTIRLLKDSAVRIMHDGTVVEPRRADRRQFLQMEIPRRRPLGLVAFYPFDGNADDASGNQKHVPWANIRHVTFVDGVEGQAAHFDAAAGSFIDLPIDASPTAIPNLTWGAWVRPRTVGPNRAEILSIDSKGYGRTLTIDDRLGADEQPSGAMRFAAFLGEEGMDRGVLPSSGPLPTPKAWTFVAASYDDPHHAVRIYVEDKTLRKGIGGLVEDRMIGVQFGPCNSCVRLGRHPDSPYNLIEPFDGEIDNVFVFRETLGMRELESIRKYRTRAILALAKGEPLPEEGGIAGRK